ncbi:ferrous iron transport protein B [Magnetospirillum sp. UT-4]|uniref:ferrous iron transport protein B n=1 Tax=Magnetospirillum sp. UT-4 TaxID=2681467 RepID=UPI00137FAD72|nr:ferrous iron transport protein B [Magnetospirillum sp. UT-4]CAA7622370.1 Fe2+ transport system protein B [Magnetospirillum sp. UT-4]
MKSPVTVALVGNPNAGSSSLFSALTGVQVAIANYPRVTTELASQDVTHKGVALRIIDVPGIFSTSSRSPEELVGCDFIRRGEADIIVNVLDGGNLDRSLFLSSQLIETGRPRVTVLNMIDEVRKAGIRLDHAMLASALGSPVVETCALRKEGVEALLDAIVQVATNPPPQPMRLHYDQHLEGAIDRIQGHMVTLHGAMDGHRARWLAIKLLEGDEQLLRGEAEHAELIEEIKREQNSLTHEHDEDSAGLLAAARFAFSNGLLREVRHHDGDVSAGFNATRLLDDFFLNRTLGLPLLLGILWVMFQTTFSLGAIPTDWIKAGVELATTYVDGALPPGMFHDLVIDGVMAGVGGTIVFLPNIVILFFFMAILSGTGYIARASFLMDRVMHHFGLHGTTLIPMVAGFGCNVPAVMATRVITNKRARLIAMLIAPFMNCSARLPVYILFAGAFFADIAGTVVFAMYMASIGAAMLSAVVLNRIIPGSGGDAFVMELPPYRLPTLHSVLHHMWDSAQGFVAKVTGVILVGSVVIWFLQEFPRDIAYTQDFGAAIEEQEAQPDGPEKDKALKVLKSKQAQEKLEGSYLGRASIAVTPLFEPLGFTWRDSAAIMTGFVAKEVVVATYAVIFAQEEESDDLTEALRGAMAPATAIAFMIFTLLYAPCLSTIAIIGKESNSWRWAGFSVAYSMAFAWTMSLIVGSVSKLLL